MLEINRIRQEKEAVIAGLSKRNLDVSETVDQLLALDSNWRNVKTEMEAISAELNKIAKTIGELFKSGKQSEATELKAKTAILKSKETELKISVDELELQISLSSLKSIDKEMAKQVQKLYETDEWLVVKPLSYQASLKYGASTKWCTVSNDSSEYYFKYSKRGILIYSINKKTGNKVAGFKSLDISYDPETSFWNITDQRIDSMDSGLPNDVLDIFRNEFLNTKQTNWDILTDEERNRQILWLENEYNQNTKIREDYEMPMPMNEIPVTRRIRRLIPLRRNLINDESELTRLLEEQITEEISETIRWTDEYRGEEYPDQAG